VLIIRAQKYIIFVPSIVCLELFF